MHVNFLYKYVHQVCLFYLNYIGSKTSQKYVASKIVSNFQNFFEIAKIQIHNFSFFFGGGAYFTV